MGYLRSDKPLWIHNVGYQSQVMITEGHGGTQLSFPYPTLIALLPKLKDLLPSTFPDIPSIITIAEFDQDMLLKLYLLLKNGKVNLFKEEDEILVAFICDFRASSEYLQANLCWSLTVGA